MNHIYRLVWNEPGRTWVAVAENAAGRGKRRSVAAATLAAALILFGSPAEALDINALPSGGKVVAGSASISQAAGVLTVQQASQRAALDWQSFNIGAAATVNFVQPGSSAVALNRIVGNEASQIYGKLNANGQVFFSNPNGMLFARGAQVNVGGILATTLALSNDDFMAGNYRFAQLGNGAGSGSIRNEGLINALGSVALIGNDVHNAGQIIATTVTLAAGNTVAVDLTGDGLIRARVEDAALKARIENSGSIEAIAAVTLTAGQARNMLDRVVNNSGVVRATGLLNVGGEIVLQGGQVLNSGTLDVSSTGGKGGTVQLLGEQVGVTGNALIDASGASGGGTILVGGDYQGKNPEVQNARFTYIGADATLKANATKVGVGGTAIIWADEATRVHGRIEAKGGADGGDGGFVETSGKQYLEVTRAADASAAQGKAGTWLLDPNNITLQATGSDTNVSGNPDFTSTDDNSIITTATILTALDAGTSVTITTGSGGTNAQAGDITVASAIGKTAGTDATLTLNAHNNINLNAGITSTSGQLNLIFNPDSDASGAGAVVLGTATLSANGGTISAAGKTVNLASGTATINSAMTAGALNATGGSLAGTGSLATTGTSSVSQAVTLNSITWNQGGTLNITGANGRLLLDNGAVLNNAVGGTINLSGTSAQQFYCSVCTSTINNAGTFNFTAGSSPYIGNGSVGMTFNNTGTFNVNSSLLYMSMGGTDTGTYNIASGATLNFYIGAHTFNAGSSIAGAGTLVLNSGGIFNTGSSVAGHTGITQITGGTTSLNAGANVSGFLDAAQMTSGTLNLNTGAAQASSSFSITYGTLAGSDALTLGGTKTWAGMTYNGTGGLTVTGATTITGTNTLNGTLNQQGTLNIGSGAYLRLGSGAVLNNEATGTINLLGTFATPIRRASAGNLSTFNNAGTLNKTSGSVAAQDISSEVTVNNTGTINVDSGTLSIAGGGIDTGTYSTASGATLNLSGGTRYFNTGINVTGLGTFQLGGATLGGTATLSPTSAFLWTGGSYVGAGLDTTAATTISSAVTLNALTWNNTGSLEIINGGSLTLNNGAALSNDAGGSLNLNTSNAYCNPCTPIKLTSGTSSITNAGTLTKVAGSADTQIVNTTTFTNTGTVNVDSGMLTLSGGGTDTGTYNVASGATLDFSGGTRNLNMASANVNVLGTLQVTNGTLNVNTGNPLTLAGLTLSNSTAFNPDTLNIGSLKVIGTAVSTSTLSGAGAVNLTGAGGVETASNYKVTLNIDGGKVLTNTSTGSFMQTGFGNNAPNSSGWWEGVVTLSNGSTIVNNGTWTMRTASMTKGAGTASVGFANNGTIVGDTSPNSCAWISYSYTCYGNGAAGVFSVDLTNAGTISGLAGTLTLAGTGTQTHTGLFTTESGAGIAFDAGTHVLPGAAQISGTGTIGFSGTANTTIAGQVIAGGLSSSGSAVTTLNNTTTAHSLGAIKASGGTLHINNTTLANGITSIDLSNDATVNLNGTATETLSTVSFGTDAYQVHNAYLNNAGILNIGSLTVSTNGYFNMTGTLGGTGAVNLTGVSSTYGYWATANLALVGTNKVLTNATTGNITISGDQYNSIRSAVTLSNGASIVNDGTWTMSYASINAGTGGNGGFTNNGNLNTGYVYSNWGAGVIGVSLVNAGTINSSTTAALDVTGTLTQSGTINISTGATFRKTAGFTNTGTLTGTGTIAVGTGASKLINQGNINPAGAGTAGTLTITGDVLFDTGSNLNLELGGTAAGQFDKLAVSGAVSGTGGSFGGLTLAKINGYAAANVSGDSFTLLTAGSGVNTGSFSPFNLTRTSLTPTYAATNFMLVAAPMVLTVTADALSKVYGDADPALTYGASGFDVTTGDDATTALSGILVRAAGTDVGAYAISQGTLSSPLGYVINFSLGTNFSITPAPLTVTADNPSRSYGDANPALTGTITGFKNGETASVLTAQPNYSTAAMPTSNVGNYAIVGAGGTAANYSFSYTDGSLAITPATLDYVATPASRNYGEANPTFTGTITGFKLADALADVATGTAIFSSTATGTTPIGQYPIDGSGLTLITSNYLLDQAAANATALTIISAPLPTPGTTTTSTATVADSTSMVAGTATAIQTAIDSATPAVASMDSGTAGGDAALGINPIFQIVVLANTTVQRPLDRVVQVERPRGRMLVCSGG